MATMRSFFAETGAVGTGLTVAAIASLAWAGVETGRGMRALNNVEAAGARVDSATAGVRRISLETAAVRDSAAIEARRHLPPDSVPIIVVSLAENRLWVHQAGAELFTTRVASGSGRTLESSGGKQKYKFDTPRGRLRVRSKETTPAWVPPDWHYVEKAGKRGMSITRLARGQRIRVADGVITTKGNEVIKQYTDGRVVPLSASDGRELVVGGRMIIPPTSTNARRYKEILGTHRLNLGDGYALHGTNAPSTIGRSVSHGCVRLRNEDIETLYRMIPVGTAVYIY
jgi:lipoprotein-anchoring transpeptidase ErfK/SrfK